MGFTRFVEVGRVVLINFGPDAGKLATIIDIVDGKRVLIDGPQSVTGIHRQVIGLRRVALTDIVVQKLPRNATQKNLLKAWTEQNTLESWKATAWAKKIQAKTARANLSDFDRFQVMVAKKQRSKIISDKLAQLA
uniref:60S ribosomal protein L14 n=1 Tax=Spumella elongata TaxID=89044 RepID=A0A7S3GTF9_9STRA|mmetsp:Transcript_18820/g.32638  ORF Transcript_18820/g.32638 Transcript_18820/m.32638 type:complete len:135 (+) Transcript_18820:58-462(+)|eukprot:CAMPEP_0184969618 /NCGR_PEP_ID=MMETSP1098-20130426/2317_1 /TAXON_ID=89044 /ORGANISM="Spumella elongata, Strain CCAP 955/1" /LENGTH=134 /DNA_ID=CAMNT_0027491409 /DNA_START=57 /DNA_END=461 /DNA_ORIENTATION=+